MKLEREEREAEKAAATLAKRPRWYGGTTLPRGGGGLWPAGHELPTHLRKDLGKTSKHQPLKYAEGL